jgi:hypothetical protein
MMKDKAAYRQVVAKFGKSSRFMDTDANIMAICQYATHPVCTVEAKNPTYSNLRHAHTYYSNIQREQITEGMYFSGTFTMLFGKKEYRCVGGCVKEIKELSLTKRVDHAVIQTELFPESKSLVLVKGFTKTPEVESESPFIEPVTSGSEDKVGDIDQILKDAGISNPADDNDDTDMDDTVVGELENEAEEPKLSNEEKQQNEFVVKGLEDGLNCMLMALDETIGNVEIVQAGDAESVQILKNLYNLQEILLDKDKLKTQNIIFGYDNEF